jgi:NADH-quinone oxidoreductase subunit I
LCVEACPTEAITESKLFEFSFTNRSDAIYTKAELVVDDDGLPRQQPWEDWNETSIEDTSAWVRATSPGGTASYQDSEGWSADLGFGRRRGEGSQVERDARRSVVSGHESDDSHGHDAHGHDAHDEAAHGGGHS